MKVVKVILQKKKKNSKCYIKFDLTCSSGSHELTMAKICFWSRLDLFFIIIKYFDVRDGREPLYSNENHLIKWKNIFNYGESRTISSAPPDLFFFFF